MRTEIKPMGKTSQHEFIESTNDQTLARAASMDVTALLQCYGEGAKKQPYIHRIALFEESAIIDEE